MSMMRKERRAAEIWNELALDNALKFGWRTEDGNAANVEAVINSLTK
jgi:hypothetical protein